MDQKEKHFLRLIIAMLKVFSQERQGTLTTAFESHPPIEDFINMDQQRWRACTKTFDLLLYASLSLKQTEILNLI